jgi:predicted TPR repeat methyltransferase
LQSLGRISFENGDLEAAQYFFGEALKIAPDFLEGLHLRGVALMRLGQNAAALPCLERAVNLAPHFGEAILNHSTVLLEMKRSSEALAGFDRLLLLDPSNAVAWNNPNLETARQNRFYALLALRKVDRIPAFAARDAFDQVALRYDQMVLQDLGYRGHEHLRGLASRVLGDLVPPWHVLDLGCGTGLAGMCFKDAARGGRLVGVDISPVMIEEARKRQVYDELIIADFETFLAAPGPSYRMILSADAMVYLGDLKATFAGVAKRLEPGGVFLFTCEAKQGDGWELTQANRFRHSEAYVRAEAEQARLSWLDLMECTPRYEGGEPVAGFAIALARQ